MYNDFNNPKDIVKKDKLQWRDFSTHNQKLLWEENRDADDLVNISNPPKQMNHYVKPTVPIKGKLKGTKLHML